MRFIGIPNVFGEDCSYQLLIGDLLELLNRNWPVDINALITGWQLVPFWWKLVGVQFNGRLSGKNKFQVRRQNIFHLL